jgi:hypothetical protein
MQRELGSGTVELRIRAQLLSEPTSRGEPVTVIVARAARKTDDQTAL